jgi:hypothetical protein
MRCLQRISAVIFRVSGQATHSKYNAFEKWLEDMGQKNECFEIKNIKAIIKNAQQQDAPKIGRPRKQRI